LTAVKDASLWPRVYPVSTAVAAGSPRDARSSSADAPHGQCGRAADMAARLPWRAANRGAAYWTDAAWMLRGPAGSASYSTWPTEPEGGLVPM
jgi:hypothetical protein